MSKVLITGATGFIGTSLINYLELNKPEVLTRIVALSSKTHSKLPTVLYQTNPFDIPLLENITDVIHIGAYTPKNNLEANDILRVTENIEFTVKLLNSLPQSVERLVFISTLDVYLLDGSILNEQSTVKPVSLYGWSKLYCEEVVRHWCEQNHTSCTILRLGHIYGTGEEVYKKIIPETIKKLIHGLPPIIYSDGQEERSFLNVDDCVRCIWESLSLHAPYTLVNVVSGKSHTIEELIDILIKISGQDVKPQVRRDEIKRNNYIFDNSKMIGLFGNETVDIVEGLNNEYRYFLNKLS